jgi:hypothetical protein
LKHGGKGERRNLIARIAKVPKSPKFEKRIPKHEIRDWGTISELNLVLLRFLPSSVFQDFDLFPGVIKEPWATSPGIRVIK